MLAEGYIILFSRLGAESRKIEFFNSPRKWEMYLGTTASFNPEGCSSIFILLWEWSYKLLINLNKWMWSYRISLGILSHNCKESHSPQYYILEHWVVIECDCHIPHIGQVCTHFTHYFGLMQPFYPSGI